MNDIRTWPVNSFRPHLVFCRNEGGAVRVHDVLHGHRDVAEVPRFRL